MKQTAVEWLAEQVKSVKWKFADISDREAIIDQAKEMEKQQIIYAYVAGFYSIPFRSSRESEAEQYYNETFKKY
jgi:hypothetical protein